MCVWPVLRMPDDRIHTEKAVMYAAVAIAYGVREQHFIPSSLGNAQRSTCTYCVFLFVASFFLKVKATNTCYFFCAKVRLSATRTKKKKNARRRISGTFVVRIFYFSFRSSSFSSSSCSSSSSSIFYFFHSLFGCCVSVASCPRFNFICRFL